MFRRVCTVVMDGYRSWQIYIYNPRPTWSGTWLAVLLYASVYWSVNGAVCSSFVSLYPAISSFPFSLSSSLYQHSSLSAPRTARGRKTLAHVALDSKKPKQWLQREPHPIPIDRDVSARAVLHCSLWLVPSFDHAAASPPLDLRTTPWTATRPSPYSDRAILCCAYQRKTTEPPCCQTLYFTPMNGRRYPIQVSLRHFSIQSITGYR
jgi:hypothetical protein